MVVQSQFIEMFGTISGNTPLSLGDFFSMKAGKSITAEDIKLDQEEDLYPCYGGNGVRGYVTSYTHEGDTVLIGRQGALCGNVQIARNKFYATEHAVVVTPKTPVNISWLYYALKSMELNQYARGVAQPGLAVGQLEKLPFVLPSMKSQNEFARVSHQADKSKFDGLKSQFIARFGITEQSSYPVKTLREIALSSGEYGANTPATKYNPEKGRYIRITDIDEFGNLNDDLVSPEVADNKYLLHKGDLLFARTGATVGKTYLHKTGKALYAGYLIKYQFIDTVLPEFVFAYTHSKEYYQWVELTQKVGAQPNISAKQYDGLRIVVPPIEEQKSFVALMNQADKSKYLS